MADKPIKVILDTNLWISYLITDKYRILDDSILKGKIKFLLSEELLNEIIEVAFRPKFKKHFTKQDIENLLELFDIYGIFINVKSKIKKCRDPKDNFLLSLAVDSNADYLVSGDNDLLELKEINKTKIISLFEFFELIQLI